MALHGTGVFNVVSRQVCVVHLAFPLSDVPGLLLNVGDPLRSNTLTAEISLPDSQEQASLLNIGTSYGVVEFYHWDFVTGGALGFRHCGTARNLSLGFCLTARAKVTWLPGLQVTWLPGLQVTWLPGLLVTWLPGLLVTWLPGLEVTWLPGLLMTWLPGLLMSPVALALTKS